MSFFSQKKKTSSQLRPLSENEIQKKLYGNLRPELIDRNRGKNPPQSQQPSLSFTPAATAVASKPIQDSSPRPATAGDLFEQTLSKNNAESQPVAEPAATPKEKSAEQVRLERLAQLAEIEKPSKKPAFREDPWKKKPLFPAINFSAFRSFFETFFKAAGKTAGTLSKSLLGVVVFGFALVLKLFQALDLRKPAVRRVIYWAAGAAALFSVFMGIHLLNVQREEAMKAPVKKTVSQKAEKKNIPSGNANSSAASSANTTASVRVNSDVLSQPTNERIDGAAAEALQSQDNRGNAESSVESSSNQTSRTGRYVIQIATFAGPNDAERVQKTLKESGLPIFVKALTRPSGRVYYSIFMGRYATFDDAQAGFEIFRKSDAAKPFQDAFIRTID